MGTRRVTKLDPQILVVEDEPSQMEMLSYNLEVEGYQTLKADTGEEATLILKENEVDLLILDWMLPGTSGLEICRQIRKSKATSHIPVILLTARGEEEDKIRGLDIGANDYVVKPYSIKELIARVRANLRASGISKSAEVLTHLGISMNLVTHTVKISGNVCDLGPIEYKLLKVLLKSPGRVYSREQLLDKVWDINTAVDTRTVDVHIGRLRKSMSALSKEGDYIRTIRGFGYSLIETLNYS